MNHPLPSHAELIDQTLIDTISEKLTQQQRVRATLPGDGKLSIERPVPFLYVYRVPTHYCDDGTRQLIINETAYVIVSGEKALHRSVSALVQNIVRTLAQQFGGFLLIELWAPSTPNTTPAEPTNLASIVPSPPEFTIYATTGVPTNDPLEPTIEQLKQSLSHISLPQRVPNVAIVRGNKQTPPGMNTLMPAAQARAWHCRMLGLEVMPFFRSCLPNEPPTIYPLTMQILRRGFSRALKQACFQFIGNCTTYKAAHYHVLGRQALVKSVWQVDRQLATISDSFDFLLLVTPINAASAWSAFKRSRFQKEPSFIYRPSPIDPVLLKRQLYAVPIEKIEDPTMYQLFQEKQRELDQLISMVYDRGTRRFLYGSLVLYGGRDATLLATAETILRAIRPTSREPNVGGFLDAAGFAARARAEIAHYRTQYADLTAQVIVRDDIATGLMVSQGNLLIGSHTTIPASRVEPLLHHEVGTHILTYFNGRAQPFQQLHSGLAGYAELQEGLAVLAEYLGGSLSRPRLRLLAARVVAAHCLMDRASFIETFRILTTTYHIEQYTAFTITMRVYRGGGLNKDMIYLRGVLGLLDYVHHGGNLNPLFVGKIATRNIPLMQELQHRGILRPVPLCPRYIGTPMAEQRIALVRHGIDVLSLVES